MFSWHLPSHLLVEFPFVVLERPVLSVLFYLCRYLFNLPTFAITFWFIASGCIGILPLLPFPLCPDMFFLYFVVDFFSAFSVDFPIQVLSFSSCFLRGPRFSYKLVSLLHRLVHLIRLCYLLIYEVHTITFQTFFVMCIFIDSTHMKL